MMGKIVALDFGLKRTGIALSDESLVFAFPKETIESRMLISYLEKLIKTENITTIVLGEPKRLNLEDSHISENVRLLFQSLQTKFPLVESVLYDERFTSKMASQSLTISGQGKAMKANKGLIDQVSATILLQSYLSSLSK